MNKPAIYRTLAIHFLFFVLFYIWSNGDELLILFGAAVVLEVIMTLIALLIRKLLHKEWTYFVIHIMTTFVFIPAIYIIALNADGWSGLGYMLMALMLAAAVILSIPTYFVFRQKKKDL